MPRSNVDHDQPEVLTDTEAKQGVNIGMYRVLATSITLAIVAGLILYFVFFPMLQG